MIDAMVASKMADRKLAAYFHQPEKMIDEASSNGGYHLDVSFKELNADQIRRLREVLRKHHYGIDGSVTSSVYRISWKHFPIDYELFGCRGED